MKIRLKSFGFIGIFLLLSIALIGQKKEKKAKENSDLTLMKTWFAGEYNNYQQVHKEKEDSVKKELIHEHIHSIFEPVTIPWLGTDVYYVKQYMDNDPKKVYRQRVYSFSENKTEKAIQLDIYSFKDKTLDSIYTNAHKEKSLFANLTKDQLTSSPGCEVFWKKNADHFIGYMKPRACNFISKRSGKRIFITDSLILNDKEIWIRDEAEDEDGNYVFGHRGKIPHKLRKVKYYTGWAAAKKPEAVEMDAIRNLSLHNQGDRQAIKFADGSPTGYDVRLGQLIYGKDLEVLQIAVFKSGEETPINYIWTDATAERIGINMKGFFQVGMTKKKM
jgi:hypothetical protein